MNKGKQCWLVYLGVEKLARTITRDYARQVREQIDDATRQGEGVLDFTAITVPHSQGYRVSLELIGSYFRVYAVPNKYNRTGRLSFVTDTTLSVRAADRAGNPASSEDDEYEGASF